VSATFDQVVYIKVC